jgi:large subunit ribosomal protein L29
MNYQDIKGLTDKDLHLNLRDERASLQKMKFNHAVSPIENPHVLRTARKTVARYLTEINRRRIENNAK